MGVTVLDAIATSATNARKHRQVHSFRFSRTCKLLTTFSSRCSHALDQNGVRWRTFLTSVLDQSITVHRRSKIALIHQTEHYYEIPLGNVSPLFRNSKLIKDDNECECHLSSLFTEAIRNNSILKDLWYYLKYEAFRQRQYSQ